MPEPSKTSAEYGNVYLVLIFLTAAVSFAIYLPSLNNGFVIWDDQLYVYENVRIRLIDLAFLKYILTEPIAANWHPLTMLSHALAYAVWGLKPWGHHLVNVVLHALNTALVFILTVRLVSAARSVNGEKSRDAMTVTSALVASLLFGIHPVHVESVAWVAERKDVLCGLSFLLSLLSYCAYAARHKPGRPGQYALALLFFALALMAKPMAVTLPVILLLLDFYPFYRLWGERGGPTGVKRTLIEKTPFFLLSAISSALTLWAQKKGGAVASLEAYPLIERLCLAARALVFYLYKMVVPVDLAPFYPLPPRGEVLGAGLFAALAVIIAISAFSVLSIKKKRVYAVAWASYAVMMLPVIGIIQVGTQFAADRYTYLPSIPLFILTGAGAGLLYRRFADSGSKKAALAASFAVPLVLYAAATVKQEAVWKDSITLWTHEIRLYPGKVALAYNNRALGYIKEKEYAKALEDLNTAVSIDKTYKDAFYNRGFVYQNTGDCASAIKDYTAALMIDPGLATSYINRAICHAVSNEYPEAIADMKKAADLEPGNAFVYFNLGRFYSDVGDTGSALANFKKASALGMREADRYLQNVR